MLSWLQRRQEAERLAQAEAEALDPRPTRDLTSGGAYWKRPVSQFRPGGRDADRPELHPGVRRSVVRLVTGVSIGALCSHPKARRRPVPARPSPPASVPPWPPAAGSTRRVRKRRVAIEFQVAFFQRDTLDDYLAYQKS